MALRQAEQPAESAQPAKPVQPGNPVQPGSPVRPSSPVQPTLPVPVRPTPPGEPSPPQESNAPGPPREQPGPPREQSEQSEQDGQGTEPAGGRAARRKAARQTARRAGRRLPGRGGGRGPGRAGSGASAAGSAPLTTGRGAHAGADQGAHQLANQSAQHSAGQGADHTAAPMSRLAARRAERARKPSVGAMLSRGIGELFITIGVLMLLFVTYQLWWTNILAHQQAQREKDKLHKQWAQNDERAPGEFEPGEGFAVMYIPKLDVVVPVAEGINKHKVLDRGLVGHYGTGKLKTAMPSAERGNFAVAGHRNTHGEPFRYINRLSPGDPIVVETQDAYYTYEMAAILPQTSPSNVGVIRPVPPGSGFTEPGRYLTMTTCTPEFTSKYRMIVWGKMVEERPRTEGKPDALVN
ncbi:class E sortase [Streptomyces zagrosensis]